jgi:hypothetical protein
MNNTLIVAAASCTITFGSFFAGIGAYEVGEDFINEPSPYGLQLVSLEYREGNFHQKVVPINAKVVRAKWAAKISRNGTHLCSGGSEAPYDGKSLSMTASQWTGDDCPALKTGDVAFASWTYENVDGKNITISGEIVID